MLARMAVSCPGVRYVFRAWAVTQPHETRTPAMRSGDPVLFTIRNVWDTVWPCGTEPKSLDSPSNRPSAQPSAHADDVDNNPTTRINRYRRMFVLHCNSLRSY